MKYAECNALQKKAFKNIFHASNWLLGGLENTMLDYPEGSEEYERARKTGRRQRSTASCRTKNTAGQRAFRSASQLTS